MPIKVRKSKTLIRSKKRAASRRDSSSKKARASMTSWSKPKKQAIMGLGFPKRIVQKHKYVETVYLTSNSGTFVNYIVSCNGMYDPNLTGAGHQPMYFDQMGVLYDHYCVIGSKCKFTFCPTTVPTGQTRAAAYVNDDGSVTASIIETVSENSLGSRIVAIPPGDNKSRSITLKWSAKKYFPGSTLANVNLQGTTSANPTEASTYVIGFQSDLTSTQEMTITIELEYIAVWSELRDVAPS